MVSRNDFFHDTRKLDVCVRLGVIRVQRNLVKASTAEGAAAFEQRNGNEGVSIAPRRRDRGMRLG
jgi:hypothetical protein